MSTIAGICYWDRRPLTAEALRPMNPYLTPGGPDGGGVLIPAPGVVMQTHLLHFDYLSAQERQPLAFAKHCALSFDGRLDNRDDLLGLLQHDLDDNITDAALVAAGYTRWGLALPERLVGDWSLAIWDGARARLLLACDYMRNRPLYYVELTNGLAWASSHEALADAFDRFSRPSAAYIAGMFADCVPKDLTPYEGVRALVAGHLAEASAAGLAVRRYWTLEPSLIRYRSLRDYSDHARLLLTEGVKSRLRARGRVWAHLSGGWDSSSIVCVANGLIQREAVEATVLQPLSMTMTDSPESDESAFIRDIEQWTGLTSIRHPCSSDRTLFEDMVAEARPGPRKIRGLHSYMQAANERVVLSGEVGDLVSLRGASQGISLLEPLHQGNIWRFLCLCFERSTHRQQPLLFTICRALWLGYWPRPWVSARHERRAFLKQARAAGLPSRDRAAVYGMTPALFAHLPRKTSYPSTRAFPLTKRLYVHGVYAFAESTATSCSDAAPDLWITFPFTHRPLVEFMAGVPNLAFWDPRFDRAGMRRALTGILPPALLSRNTKGEPLAAITRASRLLVDALLSGGLPPERATDWLLVAKGYVRRESLEHAIDDLRRAAQEPSPFLRRCLSLEAWLRALETCPSSRSPCSVGTLPDTTSRLPHHLTAKREGLEVRVAQ